LLLHEKHSETYKNPTAAYVAPFLVFIAMMALERIVPPNQWLYPVRFALVTLTILTVSRRYITLRPSNPLGSVAIGILVFVIWVAPDVLFGPGYRHHWLFENSLTGEALSTVSPALRRNVPFIAMRMVSCAALVPILEELFWRGWLMRWLIDKDFEHVPLGMYAPSAFWMVAVLFASEHGPYWEVGLIAGIVYNWWMVRRRNLADCIWAHAVTNGILSVYVLVTGKWEYWL
jgi:hypothetical protein